MLLLVLQLHNTFPEKLLCITYRKKNSKSLLARHLAQGVDDGISRV